MALKSVYGSKKYYIAYSHLYSKLVFNQNISWFNGSGINLYINVQYRLCQSLSIKQKGYKWYHCWYKWNIVKITINKWGLCGSLSRHSEEVKITLGHCKYNRLELQWWCFYSFIIYSGGCCVKWMFFLTFIDIFCIIYNKKYFVIILLVYCSAP